MKTLNNRVIERKDSIAAMAACKLGLFSELDGGEVLLSLSHVFFARPMTQPRTGLPPRKSSSSERNSGIGLSATM